MHNHCKGSFTLGTIMITGMMISVYINSRTFELINIAPSVNEPLRALDKYECTICHFRFLAPLLPPLPLVCSVVWQQLIPIPNPPPSFLPLCVSQTSAHIDSKGLEPLPFYPSALSLSYQLERNVPLHFPNSSEHSCVLDNTIRILNFAFWEFYQYVWEVSQKLMKVY